MSAPVEPAAPLSNDTGERILTAALERFAERGFDGTSMREIALAAGVSKANVFHHYGSKAALHEAVLRRASEAFRRHHGLLRDRERPLPEAIHAFARGHLRQMLEEPATIQLFLRQLLSDTAQAQRASAENAIGEGLAELVAILEERLHEGYAESGRDAVGLALILLGSTFAYYQLRHVTACRHDEALAQLDADDYCRRLSKLLRPGLDAAPSQPEHTPN